MRHNDVTFILATGGANMVKAAYSSGTPAIGVGQGNAPAWICADADVDAAARLVVQSKSFDNGVICGSEQHLVVDRAVRQAFVAALEAQGAAVLTEDEARRFTARAFDRASGKIRRELIGQSAQRIADIMEIDRNWLIRLIVVRVGFDALDGSYGREKLAPVLSLFTVRDAEEGLTICQRLLANEERGHTAIIHTRNQELIEHFSAAIAASRILVNAPGAHGCIGLGNGLTPSLTLGCGTFGGTSTTDNVSYTHLLNIKRVVYHAHAQSD
jgi:acyl-CoA reductase-like NAD-dependent aldehyde dehydrogenase